MTTFKKAVVRMMAATAILSVGLAVASAAAYADDGPVPPIKGQIPGVPLIGGGGGTGGLGILPVNVPIP